LGSVGAADDSKITPAQVYQRVEFALQEIELIRLEMGKPEGSPPPIQVEQAAPREVFFQALTLFRKADRLAFEHTRERVEEPPLPKGEIRPAEVFKVVDAALDRIGKVKESLDIAGQSEVPPLDPGIEPSQVFTAILAANRQINGLLDQPFAPADVYEQITVAIAYASRLLDSPGAVSTPPDPPALERRKRPADVYGKLVTCFEDIHKIGDQSGIPMLNIEVDAGQIERVEPSDVYDMASLLVSELSYLHSRKANARPPRRVYSAGRKLPSHVYQRLGILCGQMKQIRDRAAKNPDWLKE
jgi:hypothetical protein